MFASTVARSVSAKDTAFMRRKGQDSLRRPKSGWHTVSKDEHDHLVDLIWKVIKNTQRADQNYVISVKEKK